MAARARAGGLGIRFQCRQLKPALRGQLHLAERQVAVACCVELRQALHERHDSPDLVVALDRNPSRHARVLEAMLDDPKQLVVFPRPHRGRKIGRLGQHTLCDRIHRNSRCPMTESAASVEMPGAEPDQVRILEGRCFDPFGMRCNCVAHAELEEPIDERPVTLTGGDIAKTRPSETKSPREDRNRTGQHHTGNFGGPTPRRP